LWNIVGLASHGNYIYAIVPDHPNRDANNYVLLHRIVIENKIGRLLTKDEVVHHIDNNGKNNDPENLILTTRSEHKSKYHKEFENGHFTDLICDNCGSHFQRKFNGKNKNNSENKHDFCRKACSDEYQSIAAKIKRGEELVHGTASSYRYCHCQECRKAHSEHVKKYKKSKS
jgi:hypothetical protein